MKELPAMILVSAGVWGQGLPQLYRIDTVAGTLPCEEGVAVPQAYLARPTCALSDGGPATMAQLNSPSFPTRDADGNVHVSDTTNHRVRRFAADGTITTIVGDGAATHKGEMGPMARFRSTRELPTAAAPSLPSRARKPAAWLATAVAARLPASTLRTA